MEEQWIVDRSRLREVWLEHPDWSKRTLAEAVGRSKLANGIRRMQAEGENHKLSLANGPVTIQDHNERLQIL